MTFSVDDYEKSIARIFDQNNNVVGTGFLIAPGYVLTCAHVVLQAIGIVKENFEEHQKQPQKCISLDFHVLASGQKIEAEVVDWLPYSLHDGDVAALRLLTPEPQGAKPIPLKAVERSDVENDRHSVYGFGNGDIGGRSDAYRPKCNVAGGRFQLCKFGDPNDETIQSGFSGAPLWNDQQQCVIGMVATAGKDIAYAIPTQKLQGVLDKIKALCLHEVLILSLEFSENDNDKHQLRIAINRALRYCNPNGSEQPWRDQLIDLSTDLAPVTGWETAGRLVYFVMILVKLGGIRENTFYAVRNWIKDLCCCDFKTLLLQITEEMAKNPEIPSDTIHQHLMVVVEETEALPDELRVSIWPVSNRNIYNPRNPQNPTITDEVMMVDELPIFIREQLRNFHKEPTPTIHLFLPHKLFDCDMEMRSCGSRRYVLGSMYEFVIRTNLNTHPIVYQSYYDDWVEKWQKIEAACEQQSRGFFKPVDCSQSDANLVKELADVNAAMLTNCHSFDSVGEVFGLIGNDDVALPVAIWLRKCQLQGSLVDVCDCVKSLRERVRKERNAAHESQLEQSLGYHIGLVWEDPKVLPPGMLNIDQDGTLRQ
jgi:hypothetical protein